MINRKQAARKGIFKQDRLIRQCENKNVFPKTCSQAMQLMHERTATHGQRAFLRSECNYTLYFI